MSLLGSLADRLLAAGELITLLLCFWLVVWLAERRAPRFGLSATSIGQLTFGLGLGALIGARLAYILPDGSTYLRYPLDIILVQGGLSFWGGLLGAGVALALMRPPSVSRWTFVALVADVFAVPLTVGMVAFSGACVLRGDCAGAVGSPPLAFVLPGYAVPRYPVELYVAILTAVLAGLLLYVEPRRRFEGEIALVGLVGLGVIRFATDFMRIHFGAWPTPDQVIALLVALGAGVAWLVRRGRASTATERG